MERWLAMSAAALGREIGMGNIDPVALTQKYLDAIHAHPFKDRIYTVVTDERALSEAAGAADRALPRKGSSRNRDRARSEPSRCVPHTARFDRFE